jgi:hypothetical protein
VRSSLGSVEASTPGAFSVIVRSSAASRSAAGVTRVCNAVSDGALHPNSGERVNDTVAVRDPDCRSQSAIWRTVPCSQALPAFLLSTAEVLEREA